MSSSGVARPLLIYDGECAFCRLWIDRWRAMTGERVSYETSQSAAPRFPQISAEEFSRSVQLVAENGEIFSGAHAVFRTFRYIPRRGWLERLYDHVPGVAPAAEACYRFIARRRNGFARITKMLWGSDLTPATYHLTRWLFLRSLGVVYCIAFLSLAVQIVGLVGTDGILPADRYLAGAKSVLGWRAYLEAPTLVWLDPANGFLLGLCWAGVAVSLLLVAGILPVVTSALAWIFYLSLFVVGQEFLSFQWDILLLETGFLAILFSPRTIRSSRTRAAPFSPVVLWLYRLLLLRLMFFSGVVKLASGDPTWRSLTTLTFHYETQPLPTPIGWYAHQLPPAVQVVCCLLMFVIELGVPILIFAPRRLRTLAAGGFTFFMILIMLTGNYTFFNLLAIVLCIPLLDDRTLSRLRPRRMANERGPGRSPRRFARIVVGAIAAVLLLLNGVQWYRLILPRHRLPVAVQSVLGVVAPLNLVNRYGLFAEMTNPRFEIVVEESADGVTWREVEFRDKPGDVRRAPPWVAPHQPRLDWQMWFAALGNYRENPWFVNFCVRLLQGSPAVRGLLASVPFSSPPPRYVRALLYEYHFTDYATRHATGAWWTRELRGEYLPPISLRE